MKKIIVAFICLATFASCNVKNSDEYKAMQAERDSLLRENVQGSAEMDEMMSIISEVEENFNQIKEAEKYLTIESKNKNEMTRETKTRVKDNFEMVTEILKKNKAQIAQLNKKLSNSNGSLGALKKTIDLLNQQLTEKAQAVDQLKETLTKRDQQIAELESNVDALATNVDSLAAQTLEQANKIKEQEEKLYSGYYIFGTSAELKEANVAKGGGFLSSLKMSADAVDKSKLIKIDIRTKVEIPIFSKKANVLSDHPKESYTIEKDSNGLITIKISDYKQFWGISKFLIVEV